MATATTTIKSVSTYHGGWSTWTDLDAVNGYVGSSYYAAKVEIKTSNFTGASSSLSGFTFPHVRHSGDATSGTFYYYLCTTDPSFAGSGTPSNVIAETSLSWSRNDLQCKQTDPVTFSTATIQPNTTYYIYVKYNKTATGFGYENYGYQFTAPTVNYIAHYTITFNANGGTGGPGTLTKTENVALTIPKNQIPTRTGYNFVEWNTRADGSGYGVQPGGSITENVSKTMYAIWKIAASVITLYLPNESGIIEKKRGMVHMYNSDGNLRYAIMTIYDDTGKGYLAN